MWSILLTAFRTTTLMSGTLAPALDAVALGLAVGAVSEEVQTPDGLHILLRHS